MKTGINPKVDFAFKAVFGADENKDVLIHLLNSVLANDLENRITSVDIVNPYNEAEAEDGKQSIVDVKAKDEQGRTFQIEIQLLINSGLKERMLFTWADNYHRQLKNGESYRSLNPVISIWFLDKTLFPEAKEQFHHQFGILEKQRFEALTTQFDLQIIEMNKAASGLKSGSDLDFWLQFLNYGQDLESDHLPTALQVPEIRKAMKTLERISQSEREHDKYMRRMEYLSEQATLEEDREEAFMLLEAEKSRADKAEKAATQAQEKATQAQEKATQAQEKATQAAKEIEELKRALAEAKKAQK